MAAEEIDADYVLVEKSRRVEDDADGDGDGYRLDGKPETDDGAGLQRPAYCQVAADRHDDCQPRTQSDAEADQSVMVDLEM